MIVDPTSIKLHAGFTPGSFNMRCKGDLVSPFCSRLQVSARCTVRASQSTMPANASTYVPPRAAPWKLGFMLHPLVVTPAKAGGRAFLPAPSWIPAFAGMTEGDIRTGGSAKNSNPAGQDQMQRNSQ